MVSLFVSFCFFGKHLFSWFFLSFLAYALMDIDVIASLLSGRLVRERIGPAMFECSAKSGY
ncbi:hypothetical protein RchiOBHm_Chr2g0132331 [Rosa chinensis]|uniref:Uncharacterized protein n=1 Tax=Rosa chinensis TaxID=74649 RepID=A0A2P6RV97_ROSCH|nr:hypothetical protein RchiOBHm_Chr2g0132331 [Rosa chinensis]